MKKSCFSRARTHLFLWLGAVSLVIEVDHLVEERLVERLAAQGAAQKLNVEASLRECLLKLLVDNAQILIQTALSRHLLLEHLGEEFGGLVWLW